MFTKDELERYSRQILLTGKKNQEKIKSLTALVVGAGGLGSAMLPYLVSSGIGKVILLEPDVVEYSNLGRQVLYKPQDVGALKGPVAVNYLQSLNPYVEIDWMPERLSSENCDRIIPQCDIVLEGSDDITAKFLVNDKAIQYEKPAIIAGIGARQGHILPVHKNGCYRCVFEKPPANPGDLPNCATEGVLSPLPGVIGTMMAYLAVSFIVDGEFPNRLYLFENTNWRSIAFGRREDCSVCR